jgi:hypothetical protein
MKRKARTAFILCLATVSTLASALVFQPQSQQQAGVTFHVSVQGPDFDTVRYEGDGWLIYRLPDDPAGRPHAAPIRWDGQGRVWLPIDAPSCNERLEWWVFGSKWLTAGVESGQVTCGTNDLGAYHMLAVGDAVHDNRVDVRDFNVLKAGFGHECGDAQFDSGADSDNDCYIQINDFLVMKANFSLSGTWPPQTEW